jgi:hypothetical protein
MADRGDPRKMGGKAPWGMGDGDGRGEISLGNCRRMAGVVWDRMGDSAFFASQIIVEAVELVERIYPLDPSISVQEVPREGG